MESKRAGKPGRYFSVLNCASEYAVRPERFVARPPVPPPLTTAAWINKPDSEEVAH
jgi:hypothetical protein